MGIFSDQTAHIWTTYHARITFRDRLMGGVPKDPKVIEGWLRAKAGIESEEEIKQATLRTLLELGADVRADMSFEEMQRASEALAAQRSTNGFKQDERGLYIESRVIKAMLKEACAILFPYQATGNAGKWGVTKKAARALLAERVFIDPDKVYLGRKEPDGVELMIGHVSIPGKGTVGTLTYHEYVTQATIDFQCKVSQDMVPLDKWPELWSFAEENGLGALRSQGFGRFDIWVWEPMPVNARTLAAV